MKYKIFRPSTICGRLIEKPIGSINKFDVFYSWAAFFLRLKIKHFKSLEDIYKKTFELPIRIIFNPNSGLNIVPCDYAAKVLYNTAFNNWEGNSFYLVNEKETLHKIYISVILNSLGITGYSFVLEKPVVENEVEALHYKTVGKIFAPYTTAASINFDTSNIKDKLLEMGLQCPKVDEYNMARLIEFAKRKYFNLNIEKLLA